MNTHKTTKKKTKKRNGKGRRRREKKNNKMENDVPCEHLKPLKLKIGELMDDLRCIMPTYYLFYGIQMLQWCSFCVACVLFFAFRCVFLVRVITRLIETKMREEEEKKKKFPEKQRKHMYICRFISSCNFSLHSA